MFQQASVSPIVLAVALACLPAHALQLVFVSSDGVDRANGFQSRGACNMTTPCRTFQAAHDAVEPGGQIVALDSADYGPVLVGKSLAIIGNPGIVAGISAASGNGVTIAKPDMQVVLRNLHISGVGGQDGVRVAGGSSLTLENCVVSNFSRNGVAVDAEGTVRIIDSVVRGNFEGASVAGRNAYAEVVRSRFTGNAGNGFHVDSVGGTASASVSDSVASGNGFTGFLVTSASGIGRMSLIRSTAANNGHHGFMNRVLGAGGSASMTIRSSMASSNGAAGFINSAIAPGSALLIVGSSSASGNQSGFFNENTAGGTAIFESLGNNTVAENASANGGPITVTNGQ